MAVHLVRHAFPSSQPFLQVRAITNSVSCQMRALIKWCAHYPNCMGSQFDRSYIYQMATSFHWAALFPETNQGQSAVGFIGKVSQWVTKATGLSRTSTNTDQPKGKTRIKRRRKPEMRLHMSCSIVLEMEETQVWLSDHWFVKMNILKANDLYTPPP